MKVSDIVAVIEEFAPASIQEKWDNTGLQIGSPEQEVRGILLGFDCTPELVREAVDSGCDMVITHHPLLFGALRKVDPSDSVSMALIEAVKGGVAVYSAHTSADKVIAGVSGAMAVRLGLKDVEVLDPDPGGGTGLGVTGSLPEPLPAQDALRLVKDAFGVPVLKTSRPVSCMITKVAMCGGSGSSLIETARLAGAQLYICGDISYHHFFTREGFMIADVGHFESEVEIVNVFYSIIRKKIPNFAVRISTGLSSSNPIYYF